MEMYKKRSLKFSHEQFSRDFRNAETLRARDSSRFKRLSIIRSINDSDFIEEHSIGNEAMEQAAKPTPISATDSTEVPELRQTESTSISSKKTEKPSRLDMLYKWKQEKIMKKELEMKMKKKPFYAGSGSTKPLLKNFSGDKTSQNSKSSFINYSTMSFNSSKIAKNRILPPTFQPTKSANNFKLVAPTASFQPSRIPNNSKMQFGSTCMANVASKGMSSKVTPSSGLKLQKPNEKSATKTASQTGSASRMANVVGKVMSSKVTPSSGPTMNKSNEKCATKTVSQGLPSAKLMFSRLPTKPIQKVGAAAVKPSSGIPSTFSKGIPVPRPQAQMPGPNIKKLNVANVPNKPISKEKLKTEKKEEYVTARKGYCFKKAAAISKPTQAAIKKMTDKKPVEIVEKKLEEKCSKEESLTEEIHDNISEVAFNCDVSIIPSSFAPPHFKFHPPDGLWGDLFEEDDEIRDIIEQAKIFMSRTSTPSKEISERPSSLCFKDQKLSFAKDSLPVQLQNTCESLLDESVCSSIKVVNENPKVVLNGETIDTETPDILLIDSLDDAQNNGPVDVYTPELLLDNKSLQKVQHEEFNHYTENCNVNDKIPENIHIESQKIETLDAEIPDFLVNESFEMQDKIISNQNVDEEAPNESLKKETEDKDVFNESSYEKPVDGTILNECIKNENCEEKVPSEPQSDARNESGINESMDNKMPDGKSPKSVGYDWSPFGTPELNELKAMAQAQIESIKLEEEELDFSDIFDEQISVNIERKSTGATKRVSFLKRVSVLNSIVETSEADESHIKSPVGTPKKSKSIMSTPRRSMRLSSCGSQKPQAVNFDELPSIEESPLIPITPRRSMRLKSSEAVAKSSEFDNSDVLSPFKTRKSVYRNVTPRRSMRLICLNSDSPDTALFTPVKEEESKSNLTADFARLHLKSDIENVNPSDLIDFESSPELMPKLKSKKVSLLYTPEKRKSMRKSIRGDLMSFSPSGN